MRSEARRAIGFIGYSNSGKTTLIEKLIPILRARGLRVSAIKNAHHGFDMDRPGKDSYRYRAAGAGQVLIATGLRWALLTETPHGPTPLEELFDHLAPCDLVIVEGFKSEGHLPRIEVRRTANVEPPIYPHDPNVIALATDYAIDAPLPVLDLNNADKIADFIIERLALRA
jgi:molybdopterin-guanine dinucleotide biosynthesis adapter protein